ncbi:MULTISPECIES: hypothetical protein [unclassified Enterococcus]|uniref:hypothetical protein n=1 Tax=unclassified Enterococcus TaxID=2608891 RepID=UPI0015576C6D|nr:MULTISPECIES: hypothetical protein [unclassified Enterococcus]MBS7577741.1 hypothetical protein [Enterococcus sp. MMGLQ5-2]MBS7584065.1 hypothetical protein [Enterococcus sp. MMGLQ5-1]NPD11926.1 hypothetical protein [Enterococcus sp. MMGLQ5-1]NPD37571.1 hypothetical protein [Enterococcus sp. MMGLQ5-2]
MGHGDKETVVFSKVKDAFFKSLEQRELSDDLVEISKILETAKPNDNSSDFPDFIFDIGFIEHFQVTSSKETRKGAEHIKDKNIHDGKLAGIEKKIAQDEIKQVVRQEFRYPKHSYDYFLNSFKKNWDSHIESLSKYVQDYETGIFFIQYSDFALEMMEYFDDSSNQSKTRPSGIPRHYEDYRLSKDKNLLSFIKKDNDKLKYVIFLNRSQVEIIILSEVDELLSAANWDVAIAARPVSIEVDRYIPISF